MIIFFGNINIPIYLKKSRGIGLLAKLKGYVDRPLLLNINYCLIYSHRSYGVQAWGSACDTYLQVLRVFQNKEARILSGNILVRHFLRRNDAGILT